ncbi:hypothetical protein NC651_039986 [Populus alba x Populus x berolinensis]|nr:hypothetical protein NC651_039986 [Populus alba x Populus x berolinensis]
MLMKEQEHKSMQIWKTIQEIMITTEGMVMFQAQVSVTEGRAGLFFISLTVFFSFSFSFVHYTYGFISVDLVESLLHLVPCIAILYYFFFTCFNKYNKF